MNNKTITISIVILLILLGGYFFFIRGGNASDPLLVALESSETSAAEQAVLSLLSRLNTISFSDSVFLDARFNSLVDNSVTLIPQPVGRPNPFAPIGSDPVIVVPNNQRSSTSSQTSSQSQTQETLQPSPQVLPPQPTSIEAQLSEIIQQGLDISGL